MTDLINIRGVKYNLAVEWTEKSFTEIWERNKKHKADPKVAKDRKKAMKEDWKELQKFLPKKKVEQKGNKPEIKEGV